MTLWIGTSWKMNGTLGSAAAYARALRAGLPAVDSSIELFVLPPFTLLATVSRGLSGTRVHVGGQNAHWCEAGAWTGEVSMQMLRELGANMVELGHGERRRHFGETDGSVNLKLRAAIRTGLRPLVCVGETRAEREAGSARKRVVDQVRRAVDGCDEAAADRLLIAYEPVWAIGEHGTPATPADIEPVHEAIRELLVRRWPGARASVPVLYGGSVDASNAASFVGSPLVDGLFVGRAAWTAEGFLAVVEAAGSRVPV